MKKIALTILFLLPSASFAVTSVIPQLDSSTLLQSDDGAIDYDIGNFDFVVPRDFTMSGAEFYAGGKDDPCQILEIDTGTGVCVVREYSFGGYDNPTLISTTTSYGYSGDGCDFTEGYTATAYIQSCTSSGHPSTRGTASGAMYLRIFDPQGGSIGEDYISIISPLNLSTATTTDVTFAVNYGIDGAYTLGLDLQRYGIGIVDRESTSTEIVGVGSFSQNWTFSLPATSTWYATAYLVDTFSGERIEDTITLHVIAPGPEFTASTDTYDDIPCSISDLTGCFKKALHWAFVPSTFAFNDFIELWDTIKKKPPFGYITVTIATIATIGEEATSSYSLQTPTFMDDILSPLKTGFTWLIIVAFVLAFFNRSKHVQV